MTTKDLLNFIDNNLHLTSTELDAVLDADYNKKKQARISTAIGESIEREEKLKALPPTTETQAEIHGEILKRLQLHNHLSELEIDFANLGAKHYPSELN